MAHPARGEVRRGGRRALSRIGPIAASYIFADRWIRLRRGGVHPILELPDWVDVIALTPDDRVVLVDQYRHGVRQVRTEFPAGTIEEAEPPLAAAQRELLEETGYTSAEWHAIGTATVYPRAQTNRVHCFLAVDAVRNAKPSPDASEIIHVRELTLPEIVAQVRTGDLEFPALQLADLFWLQAFLRATSNPRLVRARF